MMSFTLIIWSIIWSPHFLYVIKQIVHRDVQNICKFLELAGVWSRYPEFPLTYSTLGSTHELCQIALMNSEGFSGLADFICRKASIFQSLTS